LEGQTLVEWSLGDPLPNLCPVIPTSNQDGRQAKKRKRGHEIKEKSSPLKLLSQSQPNFDHYDYTVQIWAFYGIK
jgi:hypothetical protein